MAICGCGKLHKRSKTGPCPACYMKQYRATETGKKRSNQANYAYHRRNPDKRFAQVQRSVNKPSAMANRAAAPKKEGQ